MKLLKISTVYLLSLLLVFASCSTGDEEISPGQAPELPPVESMSFSNSNFDTSNTGGRINAATNWEVAATKVAFWNTILAVNLGVPVTAFKAAVSQKPTFDSGRGLWVWSYDYTFVGRTYSAELTGEVKASEVEWKMYISQESGFQNVLWFSGVMLLDGSTGYWVLNMDANNPTEYVKIDWSKENDQIGNVKFTYTLAGAAEYGSYIEYIKTNGVELDRAYNIHMTSTNNTVNIEWHSQNGNGRIKDPGYFLDDAFHCWDTAFVNIAC